MKKTEKTKLVSCVLGVDKVIWNSLEGKPLSIDDLLELRNQIDQNITCFSDPEKYEVFCKKAEEKRRINSKKQREKYLNDTVPAVNKSHSSELANNIYILFDPATGLYKIGRAKDIQRRIKVLIEEKSSLVVVISYAGVTRQETELHRMLIRKRVYGEWFDLAPQDFYLIDRFFESNVSYFHHHIKPEFTCPLLDTIQNQ